MKNVFIVAFIVASCVAVSVNGLSINEEQIVAKDEATTPSLFADSCQQCAAEHKGNYYCASNGKCTDWHVTCALDCKVPCESTKACNGCAKEDNCSCAECQSQGYSTYCPLANECYNTLTTCGISCGSESDCISTSTCAPRGVCTAAQANQCNGTQTCCLNSNGSPFCSPYPNATCCQYESLTCPVGYTCYPPGHKCLPIPPSPPANCAKCEQVVAKIEATGCADCTTLFPALSWLCALIQKLGLCAWIENSALPPANVCAMMGFCGDEGCGCGYCRPQLYGQWCLSLPNKCPASSASGFGTLAIAKPPLPQVHFPTIEARDAHYAAKIKETVRTLEERHTSVEAFNAKRADVKVGNYCVDGMCDAATVGCCLTCAP